eukprot:scaffold41602_cov55-Phaeocystis_antarctica.AAC.3
MAQAMKGMTLLAGTRSAGNPADTVRSSDAWWAPLGRDLVPLRQIVVSSTSQVQRIYERAAAGDLCGTMEMMDLLTAAEVGLEPHRALPTGSPIGYTTMSTQTLHSPSGSSSSRRAAASRSTTTRA